MPADPSVPKAATTAKKTPKSEPLEAAVIAKEAEEKAEKPRSNTSSFVRGAAVGVGSAALVAALLYANRSRKDSKDSKDKG